jgi:hypothetical protein
VIASVSPELLDEFWAHHPETDLAARATYEDIAADLPQRLLPAGEEEKRRWVASALAGAAIALDQHSADPAIAAQTAISVAHALYDDPITFPLEP